MGMILKLDEEETSVNGHAGIEYCCDRMKQAFATNKFGLNFDKRFYETYCYSRESKKSYWPWEYCPFCGKSIKNKEELYRKLLKEELNISDPYEDGVEERLPEEFKTDEWWKKRGL